MELIIVGAVAMAVFGLLLTALAVREQRNRKRPPIHTCHQGHGCGCAKAAHDKTNRDCANRPS